jgi:hypothetical protein
MIEFKDAQLASLVTLTAADRKWMDDVRISSHSSLVLANPHLNLR